MNATAAWVEYRRWPILTALALLYPAGWMLLHELSTPLAYWPVALRFLILWALPSRQWWPFALTDVFATLLARYWLGGHEVPDWRMWMTAAAPVLAYMAAISLIRGGEMELSPDRRHSMVRFLSAATLAVAMVAPVLVYHMGISNRLNAGVLDQLLSFGFGDLFAMLVVGPFALALRHGGWRDLMAKRLLLDAALATAVGAGVMTVVIRQPELEPHLLLMMFLPMVLVAFRHGWKGAALMLFAIGIVIAVGFAEDIDPIRLQVKLVVVGIAALLLGASADHLHEQHTKLEAQHASLRIALTEQRDLASRIVALEDEGNRGVVEALHEQVMPPIHELRTLLAMAMRSSLDERESRLLESLRGHTWQVQDGLERALRRLEPPNLERGDLRDLLSHGPLWERAQEQGAEWTFHVEGPLQALNGPWRSTLYRIVQAGVEQGLAMGSKRLHLKVHVQAIEGGGHRVALTLEVGLARGMDPTGSAMNAVHDRTLAAGGDYRCQLVDGACRHEAVFAQVGNALG